jgi:hypothetical protein
MTAIGESGHNRQTPNVDILNASARLLMVQFHHLFQFQYLMSLDRKLHDEWWRFSPRFSAITRRAEDQSLAPLRRGFLCLAVSCHSPDEKSPAQSRAFRRSLAFFKTHGICFTGGTFQVLFKMVSPGPYVRRANQNSPSGAGNELLFLSAPGDFAPKYRVIEPSSAVFSPGVALPIE